MVPNNSPAKADRLRQYAEELRAMSDASHTSQSRETLARLADEYEDMARQREMIEQQRAVMPPD